MEEITCLLNDTKIDAQEERNAFPVPRRCGGYVCFEGIVRDHNEGKDVTHLHYEAYETLALKELKRICLEAKEKYELDQARVVHRTGHLDINDIAVMIQVASPHRNEAFVGCRYIIDQLKTRVPIWKKEFYRSEDSHWVRCSHNH